MIGIDHPASELDSDQRSRTEHSSVRSSFSLKVWLEGSRVAPHSVPSRKRCSSEHASIGRQRRERAEPARFDIISQQQQTA